MGLKSEMTKVSNEFTAKSITFTGTSDKFDDFLIQSQEQFQKLKEDMKKVLSDKAE